MAGVLHGGPRTMSMVVDDDGYRTYKIRFLVRAELGDGPATVLQTPGLPQPGDPWIVDEDVDLWTWFRPGSDIGIFEEKEGDPTVWWRVDRTASNKPPDKQRCQDIPVEDPLLEPQKISGTFITYTEEATHDRFGTPILNSAHEQIRGPQVEFENGRDTIRIEQNVPLLQLPLLAALRGTLNASSILGLPERCVRFAKYSWDRKFHGMCSVYFTRVIELEVWAKYDPDTGVVVSGFDREVLDEGAKMLNGYWDATTGRRFRKVIGSGTLNPDNSGAYNSALPLNPDPANPSHFERATDRAGNPITVVLDGAGMPIEGKVQGPVESASDASPIVITSTGHGLVTGDEVAIAGVQVVTGDSHANGRWTITVLTADTFSLDGSTGNGAYVGGGIWKNVGAGAPGKIPVEYYQESEFATLLGLDLGGF